MVMVVAAAAACIGRRYTSGSRRMQHVEVERIIAAPIEKVWARYTDHVSWSRWAGLGKVVLERDGVPAPNGVGCVRAIGSGPVTVYEEVVSFEPPHRMTYRVVRGGIPMRDHLGEVVMTTCAEGTHIRWRCQFEAGIPGLGRPMRWLVTTVFRRALAGLARERF